MSHLGRLVVKRDAKLHSDRGLMARCCVLRQSPSPVHVAHAASLEHALSRGVPLDTDCVRPVAVDQLIGFRAESSRHDACGSCPWRTVVKP